MKKATIIVIAAIYVASIVIVGVFGLKALMYNEMVNIDHFEFPSEIGGAPVENVGNKKAVVFTFKENLIVPIEYIPIPADATYRNDVVVEITYQSSSDPEHPTAELEHGEIGGYYLKFLQAGTVRVTVKSPDTGKATKDLELTALKPR